MEFSYSIEDTDLYKLMNLYGNLSLSVCDRFERTVKDITKKNSIMINMERIGLVTSSGMNSLVNVSIDAKTNGKRVILMHVPGSFKKLIETVHAYEYFILVDSVDEGKMKLKYYT